MADSKTSSSEFFKNFSIFTAIMLVFFGIIFGFSILTSRFYNNGIKESVQTVLDEKYPGKYQVGEKIKINTGIAYSAELFQLYCTDSAERYYTLMIRTATMYGPMPAVYIYNKNSGGKFVGFSSVKGRVRLLLEENPNDTRISYWTSKLEEIVAGAEKKGGR